MFLLVANTLVVQIYRLRYVL